MTRSRGAPLFMLSQILAAIVPYVPLVSDRQQSLIKSKPLHELMLLTSVSHVSCRSIVDPNFDGGTSQTSTTMHALQSMWAPSSGSDCCTCPPWALYCWSRSWWRPWPSQPPRGGGARRCALACALYLVRIITLGTGPWTGPNLHTHSNHACTRGSAAHTPDNNPAPLPDPTVHSAA